MATASKLKIGDVVYTETGDRLVLQRALGDGGEGTVYAVSDSLCAKIYHADRRTRERREKIRAMIARPPRSQIDPVDPGVAWPTTILYSDASKLDFVGFVMPLLDRHRYRPLGLYLTDVDRLRSNLNWVDEDLLRVAHNICTIVAAVHSKGHALGDINDQNILVTRKGIVAFVDCDSFQIAGDGRVFPTTVGRQEYTSPELLLTGRFDEGGDLSDRFGLATLIFRLLINGYFPYEGRGAILDGHSTSAEKIALGKFSYVSADTSALQPPKGASVYWLAVDHRIHQLFVHAFVDGHTRPDMRPGPADWQRVIRAVIDTPSTGPSAPQARPAPQPRIVKPAIQPPPITNLNPPSYSMDRWGTTLTALLILFAMFQSIPPEGKLLISSAAIGMWIWFLRANFKRQNSVATFSDYFGKVCGVT